MMLAVQSIAAPGAAAVTARVRGRGAVGGGRAAAANRHVVRAGGGESTIVPGDAPGEGKRRIPSPNEKSVGEAALEAKKGPQVNSKGCAPDECETPFEKFTNADVNKSMDLADAPGEGRRRAPAPQEIPIGKGNTLSMDEETEKNGGKD
eukprot:CAMPEP_0197590644 /NCGR_PEP_ID=MMETSP1326-20131121/11767_1 /TAXON_ID=1155430 /ORGANISM="Genus nov. species nov., Strain RCC2288" /LENGTH=148 /DNA_ID=CAMNT_0043155803 /DNA_START=201 /DNA_END=647 /DNA_ORIENTATION=+